MLKPVALGDEALALLKPLAPRTLYRELHAFDLVAAVDAARSIYGQVGAPGAAAARNLLVYNFWAFASAYLGDYNVDVIDTGASGRTLRSSSDMNAASSFVTFGTRSDAATFDQYALLARDTTREGAAITPGLVVEADKIRVRFGRVSAGAVAEVGLYQSVYDTGGYSREVMWGRTPFSVPGAGYNVYYDVVVRSPFLKNFAAYLFGLLSETNQTLVSRAGASYAARTTSDANSGGAYTLVGTSNAPFSFDQYELTNPLVLTSFFNLYWSYRSYVMGIASGATRLPSAMTIAEVGVAQRIYDTAGALKDTLLLRIPLESPISKEDGEVFSCIVVFYASA